MCTALLGCLLRKKNLKFVGVGLCADPQVAKALFVVFNTSTNLLDVKFYYLSFSHREEQ